MPGQSVDNQPIELRIQLLGGFSITAGDRRIAADQFRLRKSRSLVKLLALASNHRLHRDQLIELLWPDQDPQTAANNLYQALYEARRILDPSGAHAQRILELHEAVLSLCPDSSLLIDAEAFKTAANRAFRTQDQAAYQTALALYPDDLLSEDRYEDWSIEPRETLRQDHLRLLVSLAKLLENQQEYSAAKQTLKQALDSDALNEEAHAGLMRLYVITGQRQLALRQYQLLEETLQRELEAQPDPIISRLYQEILSGSYTLAVTSPETPQARPGTLQMTGVPSPPVHNLPTQMTSFIGREQEKKAIKRLLLPSLAVKGQPQEINNLQLPPARLVTLTGAGGCGKTRLALETAVELLENYRDGIWLVELAGLSDPDLLPQTLISILHIHNEPGQQPLSTLADYLKHRQLLLLLDNCEHLVDACARMVETLLKNCPHLQILATSQEILGLPGEVSYAILPLSLPDSLHHLPSEITGQSEAARLFVERARYARPGFTLDENNVLAVTVICQRLDGIPLAIELAAARVKIMQVEEISTRLEKSFDLLTGGSRTALPRYQSLYASIDWSYHLLSEAERRLFRRLAVFAGGWSVDAANFIGSGGSLRDEASDQPANPPGGQGETPPPTEDVLDLLIQLVNKSLITPHQTPGTPTRYFYLDTIRSFALDRLRESGEEPIIRDQHLDYYQQLASHLEPRLHGPDQVALMSSLEADHDNLRAALEWSLADHTPAYLPAESQPAGSSRPHVEKGLRLAADLHWYWQDFLNWAEETMWLKRLLDSEVQQRGLRPLDPPRAQARARALFVAGWFGLEAKDQSQKYLEESLLISRELGAEGRRGAAYALTSLAELAIARSDSRQAQALVGESLALFREVGDTFGLAELLSGACSDLAMNQGDFDQARKYLEEALTFLQKLGDRDGMGFAYLRLGEIASREGNYRRAWNLFENARDIYDRLRDKTGSHIVLDHMGEAALAQGDPQHAGAIFSEALALTRQVGARSWVAASLTNLARAAFDQGEYQQATQWYSEALESAWEIADAPAKARALRGLAETAQVGGDAASARQFYKEVLLVVGESTDRKETFLSLEALAGLAVDLGQPEQAVRLYSATQELYDSIRFFLSSKYRTTHSEKVNGLKSQLGEAAFSQAWSQGQAMGLEQAIQAALAL